MPFTLGVVASGVRQWTPLALEPLAWYDASDEATVTVEDTNRVPAMADKSGNGLDLLQATAERRAFYTDTENGLPVLSFADGGALWTGLAAYPSLAEYTVFSVARPVSLTNGFCVFWSVGAGGAAAGIRPTLAWYDNHYVIPFQGADNVAATGSAVVFTSLIGPGSQTVRVNGEPVVTGATASTTATMTFATLGNFGPSGNNIGTKRVAEFILLDRVATATERNQAEAYLAAKWGLTLSG